MVGKCPRVCGSGITDIIIFTDWSVLEGGLGSGVFPESSITELTRFLRKMIYSILLVAEARRCKQGESVPGPAAVGT